MNTSLRLRSSTFMVEKARVCIDAGEYLAEASDLGLAAGCWPAIIMLTTPLGLNQTFEQVRMIRIGGEFGGWVYQTAQGMVLRVFND